MHGNQPGGGGRNHVVVDPIPDVGDLARRMPCRRDDSVEEGGAGFLTPQLADEEM